MFPKLRRIPGLGIDTCFCRKVQINLFVLLLEDSVKEELCKANGETDREEKSWY